MAITGDKNEKECFAFVFLKQSTSPDINISMCLHCGVFIYFRGDIILPIMTTSNFWMYVSHMARSLTLFSSSTSLKIPCPSSLLICHTNCFLKWALVFPNTVRIQQDAFSKGWRGGSGVVHTSPKYVNWKALPLRWYTKAFQQLLLWPWHFKWKMSSVPIKRDT